MQGFTIPVAFVVNAESDAQAAEILAGILAGARLTQDHVKDDLMANLGHVPDDADLGPIECWWTPSNPKASRMDDCEQILVFVPTGFNGVNTPEKADRLAQIARRYWHRVIDNTPTPGPDPR